MAHCVKIFIYTTVYSKIKKFKKIITIPYLPTQKLENKSETDLFFFYTFTDKDSFM